MKRGRIFKRVTVAAVCFVVFMCGCAQQAQQPAASVQPKEKVGEAAPKPAERAGAKIALNQTPGAQTTYKVTTVAQRSVKWQGPVPDKSAFEEGTNKEQAEMVFTQRIQSVDANGEAVAQVTIDGLKYLLMAKNQSILDFDSTRQSDANSPLARLMGQSYMIKVEPNNYMSSTFGLAALVSLMSGQTSADHAGLKVLSPDAVTERHSTLLLPQAGEEQLKPGDKWSKVKTFSFGMMDLKSYEKIYTLKEIRDEAGRQIAVIDMNAIPTSEVEERYRSWKAGRDFPKMFDTSDTYTGSGEIDLTSGRINSFSEVLQTSWVAAMPENLGIPADANEPVVLSMTARRSFNLEMIK